MVPELQTLVRFVRERVCACKPLAGFLTLAVLLFCAPVGRASDMTEMSLEELMNLEVKTVVTASRFEQRISDAPASVTIVTGETIRRFGYRTLSDALRSVIGFHITYDRTYEYVGVRGFGLPGDYSSRVLLLVDGHRFNEKISDSFFTDFGLGLDIQDVDRIEIIRGPGSALYGNNAMLAVINVITKSPQTDPGEEVGLIMGEPGITVLSASARGGAGRVRYSLNIQNVDRDGHELLHYPEFADPVLVDYDGDGDAEYTGYTINNDKESSYSLRARLEMDRFTFTAFYVDWEKEIPTGSFEALFDTDEEWTNEGYYYLELRYEGQIGENLAWQFKGTVDHYWYEGAYPYAYDYWYSPPSTDPWLDPPYTIFKDDQDATWSGLEFQGDFSGWRKNRFVFGARYELINVDLNSFDIDPSFIYEDDKFSYNNISAYIQDEILVSSSARLILGLNHSVHDQDIFKGDVDRTNPRIGAIVNVGSQTTLKTLYGEAFRAPNVYELLYDDDGDTQIENPDLNPEILRTVELIVERELGQSWGIKGSLYRTEFESLIQAVEYDPVGDPGVYQFQNSSDDVTSEGIELELRKYLNEKFSGYISVQLQQTENDTTGETLPNSPEQMANLGVSLPVVPREVFLNVDAHYVGEVMSKDLSETIPSYVVANATISHNKVSENLEMSVSVFNIFDEDYSYPASFDMIQTKIPQDGRNLSFQVKYKF